MSRSIRSFLRTILLIIFIAGYAGADAQGDSSVYSQRRFDQESLQKYSKQRDFIYENNAPQEGMGIFAWLWSRFWHFFDEVFGSQGENVILKIIMYTVMIGAIVLIILNLLGIDVRRLLLRDAQAIILPYTGEENIREMNMDELIADAAAKKQWRLCVRYQYLKALRMLTDRELIRWRPGKTNMDYYYELREDGLKNTFLAATDDFENAWYGNSEVTEEHYRISRQSLESFYSQIQNHSA
ncbi:MAG: hypothetical protein JWO03_1311 [Bacteroidetes bacterium]|nr:hypothetical protein [Bacteroidota bacterium]